MLTIRAVSCETNYNISFRLVLQLFSSIILLCLRVKSLPFDPNFTELNGMERE